MNLYRGIFPSLCRYVADIGRLLEKMGLGSPATRTAIPVENAHMPFPQHLKSVLAFVRFHL